MKSKVDEDETARVAAMYSGSELAQARGWTDEYLAKHFVVVYANYYVEYDHTKTFMDDGQTQQYFYLTQDTETGNGRSATIHRRIQARPHSVWNIYETLKS